jgi:hypothetical protein
MTTGFFLIYIGFNFRRNMHFWLLFGHRTEKR